MRGDQSLKEPGDRPPGPVPHGWARTVAAAELQAGFDRTGQAPQAQRLAGVGVGAAGVGVGPAPGAVALSCSRCPHTCGVDTWVFPPPRYPWGPCPWDEPGATPRGVYPVGSRVTCLHTKAAPQTRKAICVLGRHLV